MINGRGSGSGLEREKHEAPGELPPAARAAPEWTRHTRGNRRAGLWEPSTTGKPRLKPLYENMTISVFERMSSLAAKHAAVNLGQGFPDFGWPEETLDAAARALREGSNQNPPSRGLPALREAIAGPLPAAPGAGNHRRANMRDHEYLFNIDKDPRERANLAPDAPSEVQRLKSEFAKWNTAMLPDKDVNGYVFGPDKLAGRPDGDR